MANENGNGSKGLPLERILELKSKGKTPKGTYDAKLLYFCEESDEAGIDPKEIWPEVFGSKSAGTLYQSFLKSVKTAGLEGVIEVRKDGDYCYLLHNERIALMQEA